MFYLNIFFSPSLTTLTMSNVNARTAVTSFLNRAGMEAPRLSTLVLDSMKLGIDVAKGIASCHALEVLELERLKEISNSSVKTLASIPTLKVLKIHAVDILTTTSLQTTSSEASGTQIDRQIFLALEDFHFVGHMSVLEDLADGIAFTSSLRFLHIELVTYQLVKTTRVLGNAVTPKIKKKKYHEVEEYPTVDLLKRLTEHLATSLLSLTIRFTDEGPGVPRDALPQDALVSLAAFSKLEHLEIYGIGIDGLDDAVLGLVSHWPDLQTLHLPLTHGSSDGLSMPTLQHVAQSCPNLASLRTSIIFPDNFSSLAGIYETPFSHGLTCLSVGSHTVELHRTLDMQALVAKCLYAIFPTIRLIQAHPEHDLDFWSNVRTLVGLCQEATRIDNIRSVANPPTATGS
ncbi:hypothetical protein GALMADRAFT_1151003 [Galerina marginata CBS 339.88]|uniref:F-box domain-containing protein n=1 Tax=Galerina marginata (strain CBS 339.88) TaxID=685588 RepID=A0A067S943_GALM3|nr:hypothetical protein GALMADRAFT_1151003 [Galerina marginata CBS 339.88]